jgi:hypothetical protein
MENGRFIRGARKGLAGLALGVASLASQASSARAADVYVDSSMNWNSINQKIAKSNLGDTINFASGNYNLGFGQFYDFLNGRNYIADGKVVVNGSGYEHGALISVGNGGDINMSGDFKLQNATIGIGIGAVPFDNINISGVTFDITEYGILYENRKAATEYTKAAINVSDSTANSGSNLIHINDLFSSYDFTTPYASAKNNIINNLSVRMMDVPKIWVPAGAPELGGSAFDGSFIMLGNDEISGNMLAGNIPAISNPGDYTYFQSPSDNVYTPLVTSPYLKEPVPAGQKDSVGNFVTFDGDANMDGMVDVGDLGILAGNYGASSGAIWRGGDFNNDKAVDVGDLGILATNYGSFVQEYSPLPSPSVPEPASALIIAAGLAGLTGRRNKKELEEILDN